MPLAPVPSVVELATLLDLAGYGIEVVDDLADEMSSARVLR